MGKSLIGIVHNVPRAQGYDFTDSSQDVLVQVGSVEKALGELGYSSRRIPFTREVDGFVGDVRREKIGLAFNLCETVDEEPLFAGHAAAVMELLDIAFTGSSSMAIMNTTDKVMTKRILKACGIRTPEYLIYENSGHFNPGCLRFPLIVKPRFEDASVGIDQESIFSGEKKLKEKLPVLFKRFGPLLVEEYIEGDEYNVSLFGHPVPRVMPVAEIDFSAFPGELHRIVGYRAKWDETSFEFHHTPRRFPDDLSPSLRNNLEATALECFHIFMLRDYGRVDIRVDRNQRPHVLEVNANPCISPDAGFPASLAQAGISYRDMISHFITFAARRSSAHDQTR